MVLLYCVIDSVKLLQIISDYKTELYT